jgi:DNA mismatch endonuclease, patch repair protein
MDIYSKAKRSAVMAAVRSRENVSTELRLIRLLRTARITGWRRGRALPGRPDFVFPRARLAIFVDGCFWHGCPLHASFPATRRNVWSIKLAANKNRDRLANRALCSRGWNVVRIWEHDLQRKREKRTIRRIRRALSAEAPVFRSQQA